MIVRVGELRQPIQLLTSLGALVDPGTEIDQVNTRSGRREIDDDLALAVEAAGIAHVAAASPCAARARTSESGVVEVMGVCGRPR